MSLLSLGQLADAARKSKGLTHRALASALGVTHTFIQLMLLGRTTFHLKAENAARIRALLGISLEDWQEHAAGLIPLTSGRPEKTGSEAYLRTIAELRANKPPRPSKRKSCPPPKEDPPTQTPSQD